MNHKNYNQIQYKKTKGHNKTINALILSSAFKAQRQDNHWAFKKKIIEGL